MKEFLYAVVDMIARIHTKILTLNDGFEHSFTDKELHFLVIGILGVGLVMIIHPMFVWLARHDHVIVITWLYVFTVILVLTFAIEIGQKVSSTGVMEFQDIVFGITGFIVMFMVYDLLRRIFRWFRNRKKRRRRR